MLEHKIHLSYWGAMKTFDAWWGKYKTKRKKKPAQNSNRERWGTRCQTLCLWARAAWWDPVMQTHTRMYAHTDTCTQKFTTQHKHTAEQRESRSKSWFTVHPDKEPQRQNACRLIGIRPRYRWYKKTCRLLCNRASVHLVWSHWMISSE